jgi:acetyltransferase-like isoleucine patch superfamily enzyme
MNYYSKNRFHRYYILIKSQFIKFYLTKLKYRKRIEIDGKEIIFFYFPKIQIDSNSSLRIISQEAIKLGKLTINCKGYSNVVYFEGGNRIGESLFWFEGNNHRLVFGANTTVEECNFFFTENNCKIVLGKNCMVAKGVEFRTGDSHSIFSLSDNKQINRAMDINIGDSNWIANNVSVLKGVNTVFNVILGANSTVTRKCVFLSNSIYAGVPAALIKRDIYWKR